MAEYGSSGGNGVYNQFIIGMEEEEFAEFEEATYSHPLPDAQQPSPPSFLSTHASPDPLSPLDAAIVHPSHPPSSLPHSLLTASPLQNTSPSGEESIWPQLEKSSSLHLPPMEPFTIDFSKTYSLSEQINSPITEDFFGTATQQQSEPLSLHLPTNDLHLISSLQPPIQPSSTNNTLLFDFSAPGEGMDVFSFNSVSPVPQGIEDSQAKSIPKIEEMTIITHLQAHMDLKVDNEFDLFTPMTQNTAQIDLHQQAKLEQKEVGLLNGGVNYIQQTTFPIVEFESPHFEQATTLPNIAEGNSVVEVPEAKTQEEGINWMQSSSQPASLAINQYLNYQSNQPTITEDTCNAEQRKESEQFQFQEVKPTEPESDPRKESEEFVFETTLQPLNATQSMNYAQQQDFGQQQSSFPNHQILPPQPSSYPITPPEEESFQNPKGQEPAQQLPAKEEDEDQFGDFEETTQAHNAPPPPPAVNCIAEQDNTVEINEEYMGSGEDDFYRSRQKELQAFVDSLPDYSFLFAQGFL